MNGDLPRDLRVTDTNGSSLLIVNASNVARDLRGKFGADASGASLNGTIAVGRDLKLALGGGPSFINGTMPAVTIGRKLTFTFGGISVTGTQTVDSGAGNDTGP